MSPEVDSTAVEPDSRRTGPLSEETKKDDTNIDSRRVVYATGVRPANGRGRTGSGVRAAMSPSRTEPAVKSSHAAMSRLTAPILPS